MTDHSHAAPSLVGFSVLSSTDAETCAKGSNVDAEAGFSYLSAFAMLLSFLFEMPFLAISTYKILPCQSELELMLKQNWDDGE